jgi:hypothetical protein
MELKSVTLSHSSEAVILDFRLEFFNFAGNNGFY